MVVVARAPQMVSSTFALLHDDAYFVVFHLALCKSDVTVNSHATYSGLLAVSLQQPMNLQQDITSELGCVGGSETGGARRASGTCASIT